MIKSGRFGIYNNKEYEVTGDMDGNTLLLTEDKDQIDESFRDKYNSGVYTKIIDKLELKEVYDIRTYAIYKGAKIQAEREENGMYFITTGDTALANQIGGFDMIDKFVYGKWIPKSEGELVEERKQIYPEIKEKKKSKGLDR
ncbi:hypothetical protein IA939_02955 [Listeria welshimeri]|uniref:hypothetical protein n=1 Tax=Listeria welshimeri TaxID=1643 RepID=UPI00162385DC|nr:hypothetical protein [Listeria welshimeri]MBC2008878.1 hypothetical protein [Listeria welshimeri]MBF2568374.1 hypothetical protein [Listeria welshimeri]